MTSKITDTPLSVTSDATDSKVSRKLWQLIDTGVEQTFKHGIVVMSTLNTQPFTWNWEENKLKFSSFFQFRLFRLILIYDIAFRTWRSVFGIYLSYTGRLKIHQSFTQFVLALSFACSMPLMLNTYMYTPQLLSIWNNILKLEMNLDRNKLWVFRYFEAANFFLSTMIIIFFPIVILIVPKVFRIIYCTLVTTNKITPVLLFLVMSEIISESSCMFTWSMYIGMLLKFIRVEILVLKEISAETENTKQKTITYKSMQILNRCFIWSIETFAVLILPSIVFLGSVTVFITIKLYTVFPWFFYLCFAALSILVTLYETIMLFLLSNSAELSNKFIYNGSRLNVGTNWVAKARVKEIISLVPIVFQATSCIIFIRPHALAYMNTIVGIVINMLLTYES